MKYPPGSRQEALSGSKQVEAETVLRVTELTVRFDGLVALDHLSVDFLQGRVNALIGPNGSGKTTLFNVISGLQPPLSGSVYFGERCITNLRPESIAGLGISRTFQKAQIAPDRSCVDNVLLGMWRRPRPDWAGRCLRIPFAPARRERELRVEAQELLQTVGLGRLRDRPARELTWVETQLLQVARALASSPSLMLLDEPTAGMDRSAVAQVAQVIGKIVSAGTSVILVAHDMRLIMGISDHVVVIAQGRRIFEGAAQDAQRDPTVIEAYLGKEAGPC